MNQKMEQLQNSMESMLLYTLEKRFPKSDIVTQGNYENKENKIVEPQSHMGNSLRLLESMQIESRNHNHSFLQDIHHRGFNLRPMKYLIPMIDMRKFDGKDHITWVFQMQKFFDLHKVSTLQKVIVASLYLEPNEFI
jgi:hypothetical protein